jgi:hypothetical protein
VPHHCSREAATTASRSWCRELPWKIQSAMTSQASERPVRPGAAAGTLTADDTGALYLARSLSRLDLFRAMVTSGLGPPIRYLFALAAQASV